jgi:3-hydroxymyristoyl/3-hydroxydecanoyl-(acyl carrier protein) dehydratase
MRWQLLDKFDLLKKGALARASKSFTGSEDCFAAAPAHRRLVPEPLFIEMIAQAGGVLYGLGIGFKKEAILVKIEDAAFPSPVEAPCRLDIEARIEEEREEGAWIAGQVRCRGALAASAKIMLVAIESLNGQDRGKIVFNDRFLSHYDVWNVARKSEGIQV